MIDRRAERSPLFVKILGAMAMALVLTSCGGGDNVPPGFGPADLVVRRDILAANWIVRLEDLAADQCSAVEDGITPGTHPLLRFSVSTSNLGTGDLFVGDPNQHVGANDGLFELANCHHHYHFRHYATYELVSLDGSKVWKSAKRGFCIVDSERDPAYTGIAPHNAVYRCCGFPGSAGNQGLTRGWSDNYTWNLSGQFFVLDGGDGQPPVPPGDYRIRITVNPAFSAQPGENCPHTDTGGHCHQLEESDYSNNITEIPVTVPANPTRSGSGPLAPNTSGEVDPPTHC